MSQMKNMQRGKRGAKNRRNNSRGGLLSHPPQLDSTVLRRNTRMRFVATSAVALGVSFQNLLDTYLVGTAATTLADVFQTVRVVSVEAWAVPALGTSTTIAVEFAGTTAGAIGDQDIHSDTSMGIQPAHVLARPMRTSLAADFQLSSAAVAFTLRGPTAMVVDVTLDFVGQFGVAVAAQNNGVALTAGAFYLRGLDGVALATTVIPPELSAGGISV